MFRLRSVFIVVLCVLTVLAVGQQSAFCKTAGGVDWGTSSDNGKKGYEQVAEWLVENDYYTDYCDAKTFAKTGYAGHDDKFAVPFYWESSSPVEFEIVQEMAGFADKNNLGYYTGGGYFKTLTEIFSGRENGPETFEIDGPFGLYLNTPQNNTWFTDRGENDLQCGFLRRKGGDPQALVYELKQGQEWLVAWEDLDATKICSDRDYNDMYVKVRAAAVVPEPVSCALLLLGGAVLTASKIRRRA